MTEALGWGTPVRCAMSRRRERKPRRTPFPGRRDGLERRSYGHHVSAGAALLLGVLAWMLAALPALSSDAPQPDAGIEAGRQALRGHTRFPWYDAERDALRRVDVQPPRDTAEHRRSKWQADPSRPTSNRPSFGTDWGWLGTLLEAVLWAGLLAVLGFLIYLLVRTYLLSHAASEAADGSEREAKAEADLIESLPFEVPRPQGDLLAEAKRLYEQGAYGPAVIYLFSYQLVQLDRHQAIRLTRGKTNRQYLRELLSRPELSRILERTMVAFEDVFFGHHPLDRAGFERCWQRLDDFHQNLTEAAT